ncbi:MAG: hypothetical protein JWP74_1246 [Marmoricola sp.]|nr:hypothetical protein [Marmoricola sp.]
MSWRAKVNTAVLVLVIVAGLFAFGVIGGSGDTQASALFVSAKGLYVGDDVRVLGVKVGRIDAIKPEGTYVRVTFSVPSSRKIPADAKAVMLSPSLVASRFVQLTPAYSSGPVLASGAVIPESRTLVPEEFDDVKAQLTRLADALRPNGNNPGGSLAQVIRVANTNLAHGNAQRLHDSIHSLSQAATAISSGRGDLFDTVRNLDVFLKNLVTNDAAVRQFSSELTGVSTTLAQDRGSLSLALDSLGQAFGQMKTFLDDNGTQISGSVRDLAEFSSTLAEQTKQLQQILHVAPTALVNFYNIIDPRYNAFTGALGLGNLQASGAGLACGMIAGVIGITPATSGPKLDEFRNQCKTAVGPFASLLGVGDSAFPNGTLPIPGLNPEAKPGLPSAPGSKPESPSTPGEQGLLALLGLGGSK